MGISRRDNKSAAEIAAVSARLSRTVMLKAPDALYRAGALIEARTKELLSTPGRGRMYGKHQASAPGDPPAPDTGALRNSIHMELVAENTIRVGSNLIYAEPLEFGSVAGRKGNRKAGRGRLGVSIGSLAPRPFLRPAFEAVRQEMGTEIVAALRTSGRENQIGAVPRGN